MRPSIVTSALFALLLMFAGGCAKTPPSAFYTLTARPPAEVVHTGKPTNIAIESSTVPEIVDRPQLVLRIDATQVRVEEFARWAEPLKAQIPRVVAENLAQIFPDALVTNYPQRSGVTNSYRVTLDIQSFESAENDSAAIAAAWSVKTPGREVVASGRTVAHERCNGPGYDALVDAHSRALATVSADIARALAAQIGR
jgi:uncharacterized lipoprotein YmbA